MIHPRAKAFTLIELLIVVAIIAILSAGMVAFITVPPREQLQATADMEIEQGLGAFFARLVGDAHNATRLTLAPGGRALVMEGTGPNAGAVYFIDRKNGLRRALLTAGQAADWARGKAAAGPPAILLVGGIQRLEAGPLEESGGLWRIGVGVATKDPLRPVLLRTVELTMGNPLGGVDMTRREARP